MREYTEKELSFIADLIDCRERFVALSPVDKSINYDMLLSNIDYHLKNFGIIVKK